MVLMWSGDRWSLNLSSTQNGPDRSVFSPGPGYIIGIDIHGSWQNHTLAH